MTTRSRLAILFVASIGLSAIAAGTSTTQTASQSATVSVPDIFRPFYQGLIRNEQLEAVRAALPYERVSLELSGGMFIPSGGFRLTLSKSGDATLWSDAGGTFGRSGNFSRTVDIIQFGKLSHLISESGLSQMARRYERKVTDMQTMTVSVVAGQETTVIVDYGGAGPVQLWSIQQAMMAIGHTIAWKQK